MIKERKRRSKIEGANRLLQYEIDDGVDYEKKGKEKRMNVKDKEIGFRN